MTTWAARPVDLVALVGRAALSLVASLGRFGTFFASAGWSGARPLSTMAFTASAVSHTGDGQG